MKLLPIAATLLLVGCPSKKQRTQEFDEAVSRMGELVARICECKDRACYDDVQERITMLSTEMREKGKPMDYKPTEDQRKRMSEVGVMYSGCLSKPAPVHK
jgi:hypothetical protein